jgi:hypothetical protein
MKWRKIKVKKVAVVGAIIDLGLCLNLFGQPALLELKAAHESQEADIVKLTVFMTDVSQIPPSAMRGTNFSRLLCQLRVSVSTSFRTRCPRYLSRSR